MREWNPVAEPPLAALWYWSDHPWWIATGIFLLHVFGALHVFHALMNVRTTQGTVAWVVSLITFPYLAIPLYWFLGRNRFSGYVLSRRADDQRFRDLSKLLATELAEHAPDPNDHLKSDSPERAGHSFWESARHLGGLPPTRGNHLDLLINGEETFEKLFDAMAQAKRYLCVNFFIVKDDRVGQRFQSALIERARAGIEVRFLYDEIGSHKLSRKYLRNLREAGVICHYFGTNQHWWSRFQWNFRNHRKIVVIDGHTGFLGGFNVGDEYLGRSKRFGAWRDTHLMVRGPAALALQMVFLEDWFWASSEFPDLEWDGVVHEDDQTLTIVPTGPADAFASWQLMVVEAAGSAQRRLWITSPYFVPDDGVLASLQAAALRGVEVKLLIPNRPDHLLVWLAAYTYLEHTLPCGIQIIRYQPGFLHQKVMLIDDRYASVGSANLDPRSCRLNFEIIGVSADPKFVAEVTEMLEQDFAEGVAVKLEDFTSRRLWFRAACRAAGLFGPVL